MMSISSGETLAAQRRRVVVLVRRRRRLARAVAHQQERARQQQRGRGQQSDLRGDQRRQQGDDQRADHEDQLVEHRLQRVRRAEPRVVGPQHVPPPSPHDRPDRRSGQRGDHDRDDLRPGRSPARREQDEADQRHDVHRHGAQQHPALAEPVDQPRDDRRGAGVDEGEGRRQRAGPAVAVGLGDDEQHDPETEHRDRHPRDERGRREAQPTRGDEQIAVGPEHGRTVRDEGDGPPPRTTCEDQPVSATETSSDPITDTSPYDALLLVSFGGPEGPDDVLPFLENVTRGRGIPRERLLEVGEHYFGFGGVSPINAQNRALVDGRAGRLRGPRDGPAGLLGQPQLVAVPHRRAGQDRRRRPRPGARPAHLGLLVVLRVPAVPREPRGRRRAARRPSPAGRPHPALLQPPRVRRGDGDEHRRGCRRPAGRRPARRPAGVRHALDPTSMDGDERTGRPRVQPAAPRRGTPGHCRRRGCDRHRPRARPRLLQPQRTAHPALAGAGRQRPPRVARRRRRTVGRPGADRLRLGPHGGEVRPGHRGAGDRRAPRPADRPGRDRRHRPGIRGGRARAGPGAGRNGARRDAGTPGARRARPEPRRLSRAGAAPTRATRSGPPSAAPEPTGRMPA